MAERFLTFRVGGELYALPANQVAEVIRLPAVARVPQAPKGLLGLANLRGSVLPVASVRGLVGAEESAEATTRAIVLDGAAPVALAVDVVEALVAVEPEQIETRQAELATRPGERLKGAFAADGKTAIAKILDIEGLIGATFVQEARARPRRALAVTPSGAAVPEREIDGAAGGEDRQMLVSFDVAGQEYALALDAVQEIVDTPEALAAMPGSEALVLGVTPFRDTLLPLLSLRGLLGFTKPTESTDREKIVVTRVGGALVGLLADRMRSIFPADAELIEKIPPVLSARAGGEAKISAIYRGDNGRRLVSVLAPEQLFREDVMQRLKASGGPTGEGDKEAPGSQREERQFLVFRLGDDEFGLPIEAVDEVARVPDQITRLPRTPKFLEGVVNLRGEVLPVVDQRRRFDMPALDGRASRRLVVVRTEHHKAGLIVDSVSEVLRCPADKIEPAPNLSNETVKLVHGVVNLEQAGRIVLLLDPAELLTRAERGLLDTFRAKAERASL
ncbi:purine-binding chemotaxis protein CheW [Rhodospirillales bacterium URHD0017]|nr:purine-binding chemotaxis protein CheW [Rhodospirillales bacterium URHD0017]